MRPALPFVLLLLTAPSAAQTGPKAKAADFSIILERGSCLGSCPEYKVTLGGDGSVAYEGKSYVRSKGTRKKSVPLSSVRVLIQMLRHEDFFHWDEKKEVCLDLPEVDITATLNGQTKHVLEGCSTPGEVLRLANEIDRITGTKRWAGRVHTP